MASLTKIPLSGSTHGRGIKVAATSIGSGTTIHQALNSTTPGEGDEVILYCQNSDGQERTLTLGWGGTTDPDDLIEVAIPAGEWHLAIPGLFLRNNLTIVAAGDAANVLVVWGYAVRAS